MEDGRWKMEDGRWKMEDVIKKYAARHYFLLISGRNFAAKEIPVSQFSKSEILRPYAWHIFFLAVKSEG